MTINSFKQLTVDYWKKFYDQGLKSEFIVYSRVDRKRIRDITYRIRFV